MKRVLTSDERQARLVARWKWPEDTEVRVVTRTGDPMTVLTRTRGAARLVDDRAVIPLVGIAGDYPLDLVELAPQDTVSRDRLLMEVVRVINLDGDRKTWALGVLSTAYSESHRREMWTLDAAAEDARWYASRLELAESRAATYYQRLSELHGRVCVQCGCTEDAACEGGCTWVADALCSSCAPIIDWRSS